MTKGFSSCGARSQGLGRAVWIFLLTACRLSRVLKLCSDPFHKYLLNSERGLVQGTRNQAETRQRKTTFMGHHDVLGQEKKPSYRKPG